MHEIPQLEKIRMGTLEDLLEWVFQEENQLAIATDERVLYRATGFGPGSEVLEVFNLDNFSADVEDSAGAVVVNEAQALRFGADFTVTDLGSGRAKIDFNHATAHAWTAAHSWTGAAVGTVVQRTFVGAELVASHHVTADGTHYWGDGVAAADWSLSRNSPNVMLLETTDASGGGISIGTTDKYITFGHDGTEAYVTSDGLSGGDLRLGTAGNFDIEVYPNGVDGWEFRGTVGNAGHFRPMTSGVYDIGDATHEVRDVHVARDVVLDEWTISRFSAGNLDFQTSNPISAVISVYCSTVATDYAFLGATPSGGFVGVENTGQTFEIYADAGIFVRSVAFADGWDFLDTGHVRPTQDNAYDFGDATHRPRDLYVADSVIAYGSTSVISLFIGPSTAIRHIGAVAGGTTYMDLGTVLFRDSDGAVSNAAVSVYGTVRGYAGVDYIGMRHTGADGFIETNDGSIVLLPASNLTYCYNGANPQTFRVYGGTPYVQISHDGGNGSISASSGILSVYSADNALYLGAVGTAIAIVTTGAVIPNGDVVNALGSPGARWTTGYFGTSVVVGNSEATVGSGQVKIFDPAAAFITLRETATEIEVTLGSVGTFGFMGTNTNHDMLLGVNNGARVHILAGSQTMQLKNGANPQFLQIYGNTTGDKLIQITHDGTNGLVETVGPLYFGTDGSVKFVISGAHLLAVTDNISDIGASNATRPRTGYFAATVVVGQSESTVVGGQIYTFGVGAAAMVWRETGSNVEGFVYADTAQVIMGSATVHDLVLRTNNSDRATFSADGTTLTFANALNFAFNTSTGTKIGTATSQKIGFWNADPVIQQVGGVTLTNNVASGGTTNQLDDFTSLTVYATDAAAIRNNIYQLGRKLKLAIDALRTIGALANADA